MGLSGESVLLFFPVMTAGSPQSYGTGPCRFIMNATPRTGLLLSVGVYVQQGESDTDLRDPRIHPVGNYPTDDKFLQDFHSIGRGEFWHGCPVPDFFKIFYRSDCFFGFPFMIGEL